MDYYRWNQTCPYEQNHWPAQRPNYYPNEAHYYRQVTIEEAMNIALQQVPGEVVKVELDSKHGVPTYEVDIVTPQGIKYEVEIDINTGEVIEVEID